MQREASTREGTGGESKEQGHFWVTETMDGQGRATQMWVHVGVGLAPVRNQVRALVCDGSSLRWNLGSVRGEGQALRAWCGLTETQYIKPKGE